ncbi:hypothetical protein [Acinetobacter sp. NyZ410]|uniref:hypothetical protein n=1 Tax=Acinetobacter sp. NyZ410 TaxID=2929509 RepID=UPI001FBAF8F1|nr:hypothetical protein [Acinetobacter sp. NyZ410]UOH16918.1 hypothetical protein MTO68_13890 [Acinetobacter sp. NyZ410]
MREFPKMLYVGSTQSHKHQLAQNEDHEAELRELGFVDFTDLESEVEQMSSGGMLGGASSEDFKNAFVPIEQFDAVSEELVQKELQLNVAQTERDDFKVENDDLKAQLSKALEENQQLKLVIDLFKAETVNATDAVDYNSMTSEQLRTILDAKGIKYLARDNKDTLVGLLSV